MANDLFTDDSFVVRTFPLMALKYIYAFIKCKLLQVDYKFWHFGSLRL